MVQYVGQDILAYARLPLQQHGADFASRQAPDQIQHLAHGVRHGDALAIRHHPRRCQGTHALPHADAAFPSVSTIIRRHPIGPELAGVIPMAYQRRSLPAALVPQWYSA